MGQTMDRLRTLGRRWIGRLCFVCLSSGIFTFELVRGLSTINLRLDLFAIIIIVGTIQAVISAVTFSSVLSLSGLVFIVQLLNPFSGRLTTPLRDSLSWRDAPSSTDASVTVSNDDPVGAIVPVYTDAAILDTSVTSLIASTVPVNVYIVCEPDDAPSITRARTLASRYSSVYCLINEKYTGTKAGAINFAVEETDESTIAVFDADESVHPKFLETALDGLESYDIVQGRTVPRAPGLIEAFAYYESVLLSYVTSRVLNLVTGFKLAASRAVVLHRSAFESVDGYDPEMVTEDYEFAYRCYRNGLSVNEQLRYPSTIEAAHTIDDWWGQRKRWMSGYAQVLHLLVREWLPPRSIRELLCVGICLSSVFGNLLLLSLTAKFVVLVVMGDPVLSMLPLVTIVAITGLVRGIDYANGTVDRIGWEWLLTPLVFPLYGLAATKAITEYAIEGTADWYHVEKGV